MKNLLTVVLTIVLFPSRGPAAFESSLPGARAAALGGAALTLHGDIVAGAMNPAGLSGLSGLTVAAWTAPTIFGIEGLSRMGLSAGIPIASIPMAVSVSTLGLRSYRETSVALAAAFPGGGSWAAGVRLRLEMLSIQGYGQVTVPALDVGASCEIAPGCELAILLTNATGARLGSAGESLPLALAMGCAWTPGEAGVTVYARWSKEILSPLEWDLGAEYAVVPELTVRMGCSSEPDLLCGGVGIHLAPVVVEYGLTHHRQLGPTQYMSVSIELE